jgi:hypothetical protein
MDQKLISFLQEEQREIESLKLQFEATAREKQEIEESHRPLLQEQEQIRKQLREFAGQKNAVQVGSVTFGLSQWSDDTVEQYHSRSRGAPESRARDEVLADQARR